MRRGVFTVVSRMNSSRAISAGAWRTDVLPRWMLGLLPVVWILGPFATFGASPLALCAYLVLLGVMDTRRTEARIR
jgi:hypothetical protein